MSCEIFQILFSTIYSFPSVSPSYNNSLLVEMISMIYWRHWTFVSTISILPIPNFFFLLDSTMFISVMYQLQLHVTFFLQYFQTTLSPVVGVSKAIVFKLWVWVIAFTVTVHTNRVVYCTLHGNWFVQVLVPYIATYQTTINIKTYKVRPTT